MGRLDVRSETGSERRARGDARRPVEAAGVDRTDLRERGSATPPYDGRPIQFHDVWPLTPDRKADLFPDHLDAEAPAGLYGYQPDPATAEFPLALISPASERTVSSTLAELPRPDVHLLMNPDGCGGARAGGGRCRSASSTRWARCGAT